jgi:hypothetical protein
MVFKSLTFFVHKNTKDANRLYSSITGGTKAWYLMSSDHFLVFQILQILLDEKKDKDNLQNKLVKGK